MKLTTMTEESSGAQIPKIWQPPQNSKYQKSDMIQLSSTNINYSYTKFWPWWPGNQDLCTPGAEQ